MTTSKTGWGFREAPRAAMDQTFRTIRDLNTTILPKNLKAMSLWIPPLIYSLFSSLLVNVQNNHSHLITQQSPP